MIKSIDIQNFQSHSDTKLELHKGVNIIIGATDSGKSGIIRAIRWITQGKPNGSSFRSWWGGKVTVAIDSEECKISRIKDKKDEYIIQTAGEDPSVFKAVGVSVPEEVNKTLNLNEINIQYQTDPHFLLSNTSGQVASYLNKIARLDQIDLSQSNIRKWVREISQEIKFKRKEKKTLLLELESYQYLDKCEADLEVLEALEKKVKNKISIRNKLQTLIDNCEGIRKKIDSYQWILGTEERVDSILSLIKRKSKLEERQSRLNEAICSIENIGEEKKELNNLTKREKAVLLLLQLYEDKGKLNSKRISLEKAVSTLSNIKGLIKAAKANHIGLSKQFNRVFPDRCPLCGLEVPHSREHIKESNDKKVS